MRRALRVDPPEVVVGELVARRSLERMDAAPLRIDAGEDVPGRSVLAGRVESLQDEQKGPARFRPQAVLDQAQLGDELGQSRQPGGTRNLARRFAAVIARG